MQTKQSLLQSIPPYFRRRESVKNIFLPVIIACGVLLVPAVVHYGFRAVLMALFGVLGAVITEGAWCFFSNRESTISDFTAAATGLVCAMLIPAGAPVWAPLFASVFAILAVKLPFGGPGRSLFNPAALGGVFALLCWGNYKSNYQGTTASPLFQGLAKYCYGYPQGKMPVLANADISAVPIAESVSPLVLLTAGDKNTVSSSDAIAAVCDPKITAGEFLLGGFNAPMGAAVPWLVVLCAVGLVLFGCCAWQSAVGFAASVAVVSFIVPYSSIPEWQSPLYDLFASATLFAAVFLAGDIMTAPHMNSGRFIYGICCGVITVIIRRLGVVECGEVFAVALMNPFVSFIDQTVWKLRCRGVSFHAMRKKVERKLRRLLRVNAGPFASFDFDDEEGEDGSEI